MQYVKRRGTKKNAKAISRSPRMRVSSVETVEASRFVGLPPYKPQKLSLKRPWDLPKRRQTSRLRKVLTTSPAMLAAGFQPLD